MASFSLIEVAIALGVVAFAVIPLLGLLSVGLNSSKSSAQDTVLALVSRTVIADLRRQPYPPATTNIDFDHDGTAASISGKPSYYHCAVEVSSPAAPFPFANAVGISLTFTWPGQSAATGTNAETFFTALSAY